MSPGALYRYFNGKEQLMMERFTYIDRQAASGEEYGDIAAVIKAAEQRMYVDKKRYYMEHGDRRNMR